LVRLLQRLVFLWLALSALQPARTSAQEYLSKANSIVVPLAPGTGMGTIVRLYGEQLSHALGKPLVVENKPGPGFIVATQSVLAAPRDGHTLLVGAPSKSEGGGSSSRHIRSERG
jgi:tripartite-type tricarboxylate transporter receptor subunit TctC